MEDLNSSVELPQTTQLLGATKIQYREGKTISLSGFVTTPEYVKMCKIYLNDNHQKMIWKIEGKKGKNNKTKEVILPMGEVIGISKLTKIQEKRVQFTVYTYSLPKVGCGCRNGHTLQQSCEQRSYTFEVPITSTQTTDDIDLFSSLFDKILYNNGMSPRPRSVIVVINPNSGDKNGVQTWRQVEGMFSNAGIAVTSYQTQDSLSASNIALGLDLSTVDAFVFIGGDGLVHQFMNGLMNRPDPDQALRIPFGIIPTGTANSLAISVHGWHQPETYAFAIIRGESSGLDVVDVFMPDTEQHVYAFTNICYGFGSDSLAKAEKYRFFGSSRLGFGFCDQVLTDFKQYNIKLSYSPVVPEPQQSRPDSDVSIEETTENDSEVELSAFRTTSGSRSTSPTKSRLKSSTPQKIQRKTKSQSTSEYSSIHTSSRSHSPSRSLPKSSNSRSGSPVKKRKSKKTPVALDSRSHSPSRSSELTESPMKERKRGHRRGKSVPSERSAERSRERRDKSSKERLKRANRKSGGVVESEEMEKSDQKLSLVINGDSSILSRSEGEKSTGGKKKTKKRKPTVIESEEEVSDDVFEKDPKWIHFENLTVNSIWCYNTSGKTLQTKQQVPAKHNDGAVHLMIWYKSSRFGAIQYSIMAEHGTHGLLDFIDIIKVEAIKMEPTTMDTPLCVDGEIYPPTKCVIRPISKYSTIYVLPNEYKHVLINQADI